MTHMRQKNKVRNTISGTSVTTYQAGIVQASVNRLLQKYCDEVLEPFGITKNHWLIIGMIHDSGKQGARISELAEELGTTMPYLTNTINLLESKGILERRVHDKDVRSKYISIAPDYKKNIKKIEKSLRDGLRSSIYKHIDAHDFQTYMKVMYQLQDIG